MLDLLALCLLITGFVVLFRSADDFIDYLIQLANKYNIPTAIIGFIAISVGTSLPEIFVSISAASAGQGALAIGNAIGSNTANCTLIFGAAICCAVLKVALPKVQRALYFMSLAVVISVVLLFDQQISLVESWVTLLILSIGFTWMLQQKQPTDNTAICSNESASTTNNSLSLLLFQIILAGIFLALSTEVILFSAVKIATSFGMSELAIGLSIIAIGTSLPELAASVASARAGHHQLAIANIVGSNILNILLILPLIGLFSSSNHQVDSISFYRDTLFMAACTVLFILALWTARQINVIQSWIGYSMLGCFIVYQTILLCFK